MGWLGAQQETGLHHRVCEERSLRSQGDRHPEGDRSLSVVPFLLWARLHFLILGSCFLGWRKRAHGSEREGQEGAAQQKTREGRATRNDG